MNTRRLRKLTQARLSKKLKIGQEGYFTDSRSGLTCIVSTLQELVEGVGGKLSLVVEFPDSAPVVLAELGESARTRNGEKPSRKRSQTSAISKPKSRRAA